MVLQQKFSIPIWGWATPGEKITVTFLGQTVHGVAGSDGQWRVTLSPVKAGGPFQMTVTGRDSAISLQNVLVGEVWIASGQSNMEWPLSGAANAEREVAAAMFDNIRLFIVPKNAVVEPPREVPGSWSVCTPESVGNFSAVAYFFGRELHRKLGVPIGLINSSWGGTIAEAWTSRDMLVSLPQFKDVVTRYEAGLVNFERDSTVFQEKVKEGEAKLYPADPGNVGHGLGWAAPATDTRAWGTMRVPGHWQGAGLDFSGVIWFRREVEIPAEWAGQELTLNLCPCDKHDTTYFNNVKVGEMGRDIPDAWSRPRTYKIPANLVKAGRNTVAVRVYSYMFAGGMMGSAAELNLGTDKLAPSARIPLAGPWQYQVEHNFGKIVPLSLQQPLGPGNPCSPAILFNSMIAPLIPYAIRGAIWYQGESNVDRAAEYQTIFPAMIRSWRQAWAQGDFSFLFVQLANYQQADVEPAESAWAELREAQALTLQLPHTGMAVAIDIGAPDDIHPKNKQDVGRRLAAHALNGIYGFLDVVPCGPRFATAVVEGNQIRIRFTQASGGLVARGNELTGFAVAGADRRFVWATAKIDGDTVLVSSDRVPKPVAVRYAWGNNPQCNLYNHAGLPASPFETDNWTRTNHARTIKS